MHLTIPWPIGNPVGKVLTKLSSALGRTFSLGGGGGAGPTPKGLQAGERQPFIPGLERVMPQLPQQAADRGFEGIPVTVILTDQFIAR